MIKGIDHVVILVGDLKKAITDYSAVGFTVTPGGEHVGGLTHNALIAFEDDSYIELIAFRGEAQEDHSFFRPNRKHGLITFALLPSNIEEDLATARERGLQIEGPREGGRQRPDGQRVEWRTGWPHTRDVPFLCGDVTPRDRRVPTGEARQHPNGATGITDVTVVVADISASADRYRHLLGDEPDAGPGVPNIHGRVATFKVGEATVTIAEPYPGPMKDFLAAHGEGPYSLTLSSTGGAMGTLDPQLTHGANIRWA